MQKYLVIIEGSDESFSAYVPDLPGCVAAGKSRARVLKLIREGIAIHLESMLADGEPIPKPMTSEEIVEPLAATTR